MKISTKMIETCKNFRNINLQQQQRKVFIFSEKIPFRYFDHFYVFEKKIVRTDAFRSLDREPRPNKKNDFFEKKRTDRNKTIFCSSGFLST